MEDRISRRHETMFKEKQGILDHVIRIKPRRTSQQSSKFCPGAVCCIMHAMLYGRPVPCWSCLVTRDPKESAVPGLCQGRGGAWDHRRCGTWLFRRLPRQQWGFFFLISKGNFFPDLAGEFFSPAPGIFFS